MTLVLSLTIVASLPTMYLDLPSLRRFQPKFYSGGTSRSYLPLYYDLVGVGKPRVVVTVGFGDGQAHFTFCQSARENGVSCRLLALRGVNTGEAQDDEAWQSGLGYNQEFYGDVSTLAEGTASEAANEIEDASVDLLLLDDCDSFEDARLTLDAWGSKLAPNGILLVHGIAVVRQAGLRQFWDEATAEPRAEFAAGIGLGVTVNETAVTKEFPLLTKIFGSHDERDLLQALYSLVAERIDAQARAEKLAQENRTFQLRQIWIPTLLDDRLSMQDLIDHQTRHIEHITRVHEWDAREAGELRQRFEALRNDTSGTVVSKGAASLEALIAERDDLKTKLAELKRVLRAAKESCRNRKRCFPGPSDATDEKTRLSIPQKILREIRRILRSLGWITSSPSTLPRSNSPKASTEVKVGAESSALAHSAIRVESETAPLDRYQKWIATHEADAAAIKTQVRSAEALTGPKISLLVPVYNPPANYLEEMLASVAEQTYSRWELCIVEAGSCKDRVTTQILALWERSEPRMRVERLDGNPGIPENTNKALAMATGEFVGLLDHDDLLAPFALYEVALAIGRAPECDILYSDEDRWNTSGKRHSPFFKPEWSPELLYSCMYLGHLSIYRRKLLDDMGGFRSEYNLSQDYDLALRATERARVVQHIPHILYHWREHPLSGSAGGKPHARKSNLAALADATERRKLSADVLEYPTANRVRCKIVRNPKVSIIIPTDSRERADACLRKLPPITRYDPYELVIVTNIGLIKEICNGSYGSTLVQLVAYDAPFNFSAKCNAGARAATGELIVFFNDDVEPITADWIENLIEPLQNPEVGAVAPKLLYENGTIQHAGLVTGVRGLVGTAFHEEPEASTIHVNFAQSMRDVSALSGACLAMRRSEFFEVGGYDEENVPISHSDVDLCFKIRAVGMRCVYTPFVTLTHPGHTSLGEPSATTSGEAKDKSDIYLLRRWGGFISRDPYFPENMRDWLYSDSPEPIKLSGTNEPSAKTGPDILLTVPNLTINDSTSLMFLVASWCLRHDIFAVTLAAQDGPLRTNYEAAGLALIVDPLISNPDAYIRKFRQSFDCEVNIGADSSDLIAHLIAALAFLSGAGQATVDIDTEIRLLDEQAKRSASLYV